MPPLFDKFLKAENISVERIIYERHGGLTCGYLFCPQVAKPDLVLSIHGTGDDALFPLLQIFRTILKLGYQLFCFDLDGHGKDSSSLFHPAHIGSAIETAWDQASQLTDASQMHLLGHSFGASLAYSQAAFLNPQPGSLVLISAPVTLNVSLLSALNELRALVNPTVYHQARSLYGFWEIIPAVGCFKRGRFPFRLDPALIPRTKSYISLVEQTVFKLQLSEVSLTQPTLLIYGEKDFIVPMKNAYTLQSNCPHSKLQILPHQTHFSTPLAKTCIDSIRSWFTKASNF